MLKDTKNVYFVGIGGIGMSAIARWFNTQGCIVAGYDRSPTPLTDALISEGMQIHFEDDPELIPEVFRKSPLSDHLIIYTPAIPKDQKELNFFKSGNYTLKKRAEVLGMITKDYFTIAVAGTHGKTTTSSMIAHILHNSPKSCTAFLGGIMQNYSSNLLLSKASDKETLMVVEADEYDKSFLQLHPDYAVITSMDADHLDIYGDKNHMRATFIEFAKKIHNNGRLFIKNDLDLNQTGEESSPVCEKYALTGEADYVAESIRIEDGIFHFDFISYKEKIRDLSLQMAGFHNVENAIAAIAVCANLGVDTETIREALASFRGVERRFDYIIKSKKIAFIDDYAHHPREIEALLKSVREMYPGKKITAIFQPHLYSRTRDFAEGFAESLSLCDELFLLDIYPARELPMEGVSSQIILDKVTIDAKQICSKEDLLRQLEVLDIDVILTIGAGDIALMIDKIKAIMLKKS